MSGGLMIPPNFVTLRHLKELKEKREEEERLKKEEEERLLKLKEEEEERERRELEEEEDRLRKLKEEEESRKNPSAKTAESKGPYRGKWRRGGLRRGVNPVARPSRGGSSVEAQVAANGGSGDRGSSLGANLEAEVALGNGRAAVKASTAEELKKKKRRRRKKKNWGKMKEKEEEIPIGLNGSDEGRKGFRSPAGANGFEKEKKSTNVTRNGNGSDKKISGGVSYPPVKVTGSESGPMVADIQKRVSDLKMGGRNPNPSRRGRPYWAAPSGRGGRGNGSVMMWVKKTTTEA